MDWNQTCDRLRNRMFALARCPWEGKVECVQGPVLTAALEGDVLTIQAPDLSGAARGMFLSACALRDHQPIPALGQKRHIASCGMMVDMSRGGVMTVKGVKELIDAHAALGLNLMMLYTEDTYPVPEYPYLGYLRGRYTAEELQELDTYAWESGVELVPCIQTLAHLEQLLQWNENIDMRDNDTCLLVDEPKVYDFIAAELRAAKRIFRSNRIHIGMDEAHGIGLGRYYEKHGPSDRFSLLTRHLNRVVNLCQELDLHPIMWSDMFYRLGSKINDYYDTTAVVPQQVIDQIPQVALCYWDYYHQDESFYTDMFHGHAAMGKEVVFAGGIWTWSGLLPQVKRTEATTYPALRACLKCGIQTVLATCWGDDGAETDYRLALHQLPIYSEHCWQGDVCTKAEIDRLGEEVTGLSTAAYEAMGDFYPDAEDRRPGKGLFYADPLYPLLHGLWDLTGYGDRLQKAIDTLAPLKDDPRCDYAWTLLSIAKKKLDWISLLRPAYVRKDRATVQRLVDQELPALKALYQRFFTLWRDQWESCRKRNGWETPCARVGALLLRLDDVEHTLRRWLQDDSAMVEELEETPLCARRMYGREDYHTFTFPQFR